MNTNKFSVGQRVVCVDAEHTFVLQEGAAYTVARVDDDGDITLDEHRDKSFWMRWRFEDADTWAASHGSNQVKASDADELQLTKLQVVSLQATVSSLQEFKKLALEREQRLYQFVRDIADCQYSSLNHLETVAEQALKELFPDKNDSGVVL